MTETTLSLIQYFKDQHSLKGLGNKQKIHLKHLVGPTLGVEFPPVTGCGPVGARDEAQDLYYTLYIL